MEKEDIEVGMKVKAIEGSHKGKTGKVKEIECSLATVDFSESGGNDNWIVYIREIVEVTDQTKDELKVGDKVIFTNCRDVGISSDELGKTGLVTKISGKSIYVEAMESRRTWSTDIEFVKKIYEEPTGSINSEDNFNLTL